MTCGRHAATAWATASEPSIWVRNGRLLGVGRNEGTERARMPRSRLPRSWHRGRRGSDPASPQGARAGGTRPVKRGQASEHHEVGHRSPDVLACDVGRRNGEEAADSESGRQLIQAEFARREGRVDECVAVRLEGRRRRRPGAAGSSPAPRGRRESRRAPGRGSPGRRRDRTRRQGAPVRSEPKLGKGLGVATFIECGNGQQLGGSDHALSASAVDADLEHALNVCRGSR
jgi:hypothetical protein